MRTLNHPVRTLNHPVRTLNHPVRTLNHPVRKLEIKSPCENKRNRGNHAITVYIPARIKSCQNLFLLTKFKIKTLLFLVGYYLEVKCLLLK